MSPFSNIDMLSASIGRHRTFPWYLVATMEGVSCLRDFNMVPDKGRGKWKTHFFLQIGFQTDSIGCIYMHLFWWMLHVALLHILTEMKDPRKLWPFSRPKNNKFKFKPSFINRSRAESNSFDQGMASPWIGVLRKSAFWSMLCPADTRKHI